jgi:hypothetical protein
MRKRISIRLPAPAGQRFSEDTAHTVLGVLRSADVLLIEDAPPASPGTMSIIVKVLADGEALWLSIEADE